MSKTLIDTEVLHRIAQIIRALRMSAEMDGDTAAIADAVYLLDQIDGSIKDSTGLRIFTKEEVEALEKHFDLEAFFEE